MFARVVMLRGRPELVPAGGRAVPQAGAPRHAGPGRIQGGDRVAEPLQRQADRHQLLGHAPGRGGGGGGPGPAGHRGGGGAGRPVSTPEVYEIVDRPSADGRPRARRQPERHRAPCGLPPRRRPWCAPWSPNGGRGMFARTATMAVPPERRPPGVRAARAVPGHALAAPGFRYGDCADAADCSALRWSRSGTAVGSWPPPRRWWPRSRRRSSPPRPSRSPASVPQPPPPARGTTGRGIWSPAPREVEPRHAPPRAPQTAVERVPRAWQDRQQDDRADERHHDRADQPGAAAREQQAEQQPADEGAD